MKKVVTVLVCLLVAFSGVPMAGCSGEKTEELDPTRTQLYVGNFDGGIGSAWLDMVKQKFEADYANESFEPGKRGVQIYIDNHKDNYSDTTFLTKIATSRQDVIFAGTITYPNFVAQNVLLDITDVVTDKSEEVVGEDGVTTKVSIEAKMDPTLAAYYKWNGTTYYAIPFFDAIYGIVYDVDLFEDYGFFDDGFGPDGIEGTYDDGLPATWSDFKTLIIDMVNSGVTPFTWSGMHSFYRTAFLTSVWASYEGKENFELNYSFSGTDTSQNDLPISLSNGYMLQNQPGKLAALKVAEYIMSSANNYSRAAMYTTQTHTQAQEEFLYSVEENKPIAMILEGGWWENEARDVFDAMGAKKTEYAYGNRRLGFMPFPKFTEEDGLPAQEQRIGTTLYSTHGRTVVCINAATEKEVLAKEFLKYTTSNEILSLFTMQTGVPRPYTYELTDEQLSGMTYFGRMLWEIVADENTEVAYDMQKQAMMYNNASYFGNWAWGTRIGTSTHNEPILTFYNNPSLTAEEYWAGQKILYSETNWRDTLGSYFA